MIVIPGIGLAGLLLLIAGVRGKRIAHTANCRKCRYDLSATDPLPSRCPECGRALDKKRAVRPTLRRKRPIVLTLGVCVLLFSAISTVINYGLVSQAFWVRHAPTWALRHIGLPLFDTTGDAAIYSELCERIANGSVSDATIAALAQEAIKDQGAMAIANAGAADPFAAWDLNRGDIVMEAMASGLLTDTEIEAFVRNALRFSGQTKVQMQVDLLTPQLAYEAFQMIHDTSPRVTLRQKQIPHPQVHITNMAHRLGSQVQAPSRVRITTLLFFHAPSFGAVPSRPTPCQEGPYHCTLTCDIAINTSPSWTETVQFTAIARNPSTIPDRHQLLTRIRSSCTPLQLTATQSPSGIWLITGTLTEALPSDLDNLQLDWPELMLDGSMIRCAEYSYAPAHLHSPSASATWSFKWETTQRPPTQGTLDLGPLAIDVTKQTHVTHTEQVEFFDGDTPALIFENVPITITAPALAQPPTP